MSVIIKEVLHFVSYENWNLVSCMLCANLFSFKYTEFYNLFTYSLLNEIVSSNRIN
jgi:hypothetical protein